MRNCGLSDSGKHSVMLDPDMGRIKKKNFPCLSRLERKQGKRSGREVVEKRMWSLTSEATNWIELEKFRYGSKIRKIQLWKFCCRHGIFPEKFLAKCDFSFFDFQEHSVRWPHRYQKSNADVINLARNLNEAFNERKTNRIVNMDNKKKTIEFNLFFDLGNSVREIDRQFQI